MKTFLTSDLHFNHARIIEYSHRPYTDIEHMNEMLISNWNNVVSQDDLVYIIGDVAMGDKSKMSLIAPRLMGCKILIQGNHDLGKKGKLHPAIAEQFKEVYEEFWTEIDGTKVYMRHIPDMSFVPSERASIHLCGHVHESWNRIGPIINVGVDVRVYKPVTLQELLADTEERRGHTHREY